MCRIYKKLIEIAIAILGAYVTYTDVLNGTRQCLSTLWHNSALQVKFLARANAICSHQSIDAQTNNQAHSQRHRCVQTQTLMLKRINQFSFCLLPSHRPQRQTIT